MKLKTSTALAALATALTLAAVSFSPTPARAQSEMKDMPGMAPKITPTATPQPADAAKVQADMDAMPGMAPKPALLSKKPAPSDAEKAKADMDAMPGMSTAASKSRGPVPVKDDMSGMPGMAAPRASKSKPMATMPGMASGGVSAPARMSAPGVTILRPPQKWVPPHGDNRAAELLSRPALEEFMKPLPPPIEDSMLHSLALFDLLEYRANSAGSDTLAWDFVGWFGGDYNRLWVKSEGSLDLSAGNRGVGDLQLLYGRMIAPFWDLQLGVRAKQNLGSGFNGNTRTYAVIGLQGLAPGNFDIEPAIFISDGGEVSAELTVSADLYLTQRLILQPRFQGEISLQGDDRFGTGTGVTETDIGLRLRYEIAREFAPYVGVSWLKQYGETARITRSEGDPTDAVALVIGLRLWW